MPIHISPKVLPNHYSDYLSIQQSTSVQETDNFLRSSEGHLLEEILKWNPESSQMFLQDPVWDRCRFPLRYYICNNDLPSHMMKLVGVAFNSWTYASEGRLSFVETIHGFDHDIKITWSDTTFIDRPYEAGHNTVKILNHRIDYSEVTLIQSPLFDRSGQLTQEERLRRTLLHEIGHALGLKHSHSSQDIMYHRAIMNENIAKGDRQRLKKLYPDVKQSIMA